jgi:tetratricopeptide (TPR) repeat protein
MNTLAEQQIFFQASARRFADHYKAYAQAHEADFNVLEEELDNILRALGTYRNLQTWFDIVCFVQALDDFLDGRGHWTELRFWLEQIANHSEASDDLTTRLQLLCSLARVTSAQGDLDKAEALYQKAIDLAEQANDKTHLGPAYYGLYSVYLNRGKPHKARIFLEKVEAIAQQAGDQIQEKFASYFLKASNLPSQGEKGLPTILNSLGQIAKRLGRFGKAHTLSMRAWAHLVLEQYGRARKYYLQALEYVKQERDAQGTAFVLYQLGLIATMEDDLGEALAYFQESKSTAEQLNDETGLLLLYTSIGLLYMRQERFDLARPYFEQSVILARSSGHQQEIANNLYWLGYAVANTGDLARAEQLFQESLAVFTQLDPSEAKKVQSALSRLHTVMSRGNA